MSRSTDALPGPSHPARDPRQQLEEADRLRQQGKLDRAETICHALTRRHPGYVAALHTLGLVQLDKGNYDRALDCPGSRVSGPPVNHTVPAIWQALELPSRRTGR